MMLNTAIVARTRKTAAEASRKVSTGPSTIHWRPTARCLPGSGERHSKAVACRAEAAPDGRLGGSHRFDEIVKFRT